MPAPTSPAATSSPEGTDPGPHGDDWVGLSADALPAEAMSRWATTPDAGAVVTFAGTVRDHAPGRTEVTSLTYEAWDDVAVRRLRSVVDEVRARWPEVRRVAAVHRVGRLEVGETAVVVVVSAAHRGPAFEAAAHAIDRLKETVPLWKKEAWSGGEHWGTDASPLRDDVGSR